MTDFISKLPLKGASGFPFFFFFSISSPAECRREEKSKDTSRPFKAGSHHGCAWEDQSHYTNVLL